MNSHLRPLFAAAALATALFTPSAFATPVVIGTPDSGSPGDPISVFVTVSDDGSTGFNMNNIWTLDFRLRWDHAALGDLLSTSTMSIDGGAAMNLAALAAYLDAAGDVNYHGEQDDGAGPTGFYDGVDGTYYLSWSNDFMAASGLDFGSGFTFNAKFNIQPGAGGNYAIDFVSKNGTQVSSLGDDSFGAVLFDYTAVTDPTRPMQVNVPIPAPEPGILALLVGGLGALGAARLRRRNSL